MAPGGPRREMLGEGIAGFLVEHIHGRMGGYGF